MVPNSNLTSKWIVLFYFCFVREKYMKWMYLVKNIIVYGNMFKSVFLYTLFWFIYICIIQNQWIQHLGRLQYKNIQRNKILKNTFDLL